MFEAIAAFRERLTGGEVLIGSGVYLTDPQSSDALADSVDFLWYDLEHSAMSIEALRGHLIVARNRKIPSVVRVPYVGTPFIKPVLDAGADGVIVPQIHTVDEVRQVVDDCRYPPVGARGFGPMVPSNYGRNAGPEYVRAANENVFAAIMIETVDAVESIDEIVAVEGLDSVVIGPWDLSASFGRLGEVDHPDVVAAMVKVTEAARAAGVFVGSGMGPDPDFATLQVNRGVQWLQMGGDLGYLYYAMDQVTSAVRARIKG